MKLILSSLLLPLLAAAAPAAAPEAAPAPAAAATPPHPPFTVMSVRSGSPIHFLTMTARDQRFWLGGKTSSFCPSNVGTSCPPGTQTVFAPGGSSMDVEVPGGQQVYVGPQGALRFTQAHSAFIPPGSSLGPFKYEHGNPYSHYVYTGEGASGFMACPTKNGRWQVFAAIQNATVPSGNVNDCLGFDALALTYKGPIPAWQYV